jgi:DNA-binding transcriptional MocR family regulator
MQLLGYSSISVSEGGVMLKDVPMPKRLYERLAAEVAGQIQSGLLRPGDRLPSVRLVSRQKRLSITTVNQAYQVLEDRGLIEARPQSGYYVRWQRPPGQLAPKQPPDVLAVDPPSVRLEDLTRRLREDASTSRLVQFGAAVPAPDLIPSGRLNNELARVVRSGRVPAHLLGTAQGSPELRVQIARRESLAGCHLATEEIYITNGCTEALYLALRAICAPGDVIAIESPTYFGILQVIEALDLRVLEIPCDPTTGLDLDTLRLALRHQAVRAVVAVTNFSNPVGACMPEANKRALVEMLAPLGIPLIEDDLYGELYFGDRRPAVARSFDSEGGVLLCSSFSKSTSPGYRVGWLAPGPWAERVERLKAALNLFSPVAPQLAIAGFLESGGFDHTLRRMRRVYAQRTARMADAVLRDFPAGTRVSSPQGGYVLWVRLPEAVDSLELYRRALAAQITVAPGYLFAPGNRYRNYIRLNAAMLLAETEWAVKRLGDLAKALTAAQ